MKNSIPAFILGLLIWGTLGFTFFNPNTGGNVSHATYADFIDNGSGTNVNLQGNFVGSATFTGSWLGDSGGNYTIGFAPNTTFFGLWDNTANRYETFTVDDHIFDFTGAGNLGIPPLTVKADFFVGDGSGLTGLPSSSQFDSGLIGVTGGNTVSAAHGLGHTPTHVWMELRCVTADANLNMNPGDMLQLTWMNDGGNSWFCYADSINVEASFPDTIENTLAATAFPPRGGGPSTFVSDPHNFVLVLHAQ